LGPIGRFQSIAAFPTLARTWAKSGNDRSFLYKCLVFAGTAFRQTEPRLGTKARVDQNLHFAEAGIDKNLADRARRLVYVCALISQRVGGIDGRFSGYLSQNRREVLYGHSN
jgi:hypothetical protein